MFAIFHRLKRRCPYCRSSRIRRKPRRGFFKKHVFPLAMGYPFHCGSCQRDFILFVGRSLDHYKGRSSEKQGAGGR